MALLNERIVVAGVLCRQRTIAVWLGRVIHVRRNRIELRNLFVERRRYVGEFGQRTIDFVDAILEYIADQEIDYVYALFWIFLEEFRKAEAVAVKRVHQFPHRLDALIQFGLELSKPLG